MYEIANTYFVKEQKKVIPYEGKNEFSVSIRLYNNDSFAGPLTGGVSVSRRIYGGALIEDNQTHGTNIVIQIKSLWMTQSQDPNDRTFYPILVQGCPVNGEEHDFKFHKLENENLEGAEEGELHSHEVFFSMKGIQFTPRDSIKTTDPIFATSHLHAIIQICMDGDDECLSECSAAQARSNKIIKSSRIPDSKSYEKRVLVGPPKELPVSRFTKGFNAQNQGFMNFFMSSQDQSSVRREQAKNIEGFLRFRRSVEEEIATAMNFSSMLSIFELDTSHLYEDELNDYDDDEEDGEHNANIINRYFEPDTNQVSTLGPIYWKNDDFNDFKELFEKTSRKTKEIEENNMKNVIIISSVVISLCVILLFIVIYYYHLWSKQQSRVRQSDQVISSIYRNNFVTV